MMMNPGGDQGTDQTELIRTDETASIKESNPPTDDVIFSSQCWRCLSEAAEYQTLRRQ